MAVRFLTLLALLPAPAAVVVPSPAAAQMQGSLACSTNSSYSQRWSTRRYEYTGYGQEVQNGCDIAIRYYYCFSTDPNPESCSSTAQFRYVTLQPGGRQRLEVNRSDSLQYVHNIQCGADEPLIDWRSQFTTAKGPRCQTALPANVNRASYPQVGIAPDPAAPKVTPSRLERVLSAVEFPLQLVGTMAEGRTVAHFAISPQGRAVGCRIVSSAGFYLMDKATCDVFMRHGRFIPATDASGAPVAGFYEGRITWTSP